MAWLFFVAVTACCWGAYGPTLHAGQVALGASPMRALLCGGMAYFFIGVLIPGGVLPFQGEARQLNGGGGAGGGLGEGSGGGNPPKPSVDAREIAYGVTFMAAPRAIAINGDVIAAGGGLGAAIHY